MNKKSNELKKDLTLKNKLYFFINDYFKENFPEHFNVERIITPKYFFKNDFKKYFYNLKDNRNINFDSLNSSEITTISNNFFYNNWILDETINYEVKNNNGLYSFFNFIERDCEINDFSSFEKNYLKSAFVFNNSLLEEEKSSDILKKLYHLIYKLNDKISINFKVSKLKFPKDIKYFEYKNLIKNNFFDTPQEKVLTELSLKEGVFLLKEDKIYRLIFYFPKKKTYITIGKIEVFPYLEDTFLYLLNVDLDLINLIILNKKDLNEVQNNF